MAFRALVLDKTAQGGVTARVAEREEADLPEGSVLVGVEWAGFNYKDGLALAGQGNIVRDYPHVPGIDFSGRVIESSDRRYHPGQAVILTGWRVGETRWGGFATRARVDADWLVPLPKKLSTRDAMVLGTAGLTAMLAINRLKGNGLKTSDGPVLVTGAGGGVGSQAVMLLSRLGHVVEAVTGRPELGAHLRRLGASTIIDRAQVLEQSGKGLDKELWAAAVDPVGGPILGEVLKKIKRDGAVAVVGLAGGANWEASVVPFILRGISLLGVDSVMQPYDTREAAWERLSDLYMRAAYEPMVTEIGLEDLPAMAEKILAGEVAGRVVVNPREGE